MVVPGYLPLTDCGAHSSRDCGVVGLSGTKRAAFAACKSPCPWEKHFQISMGMYGHVPERTK